MARTGTPRRTLPKPGHVALHRLPPQLRRLVQVLGEAAAYRLVDSYGGTRLVVPARVQPQHAEHGLCLVLGAQAFAALVAEYAGQPMDLPKTDSLLLQVRHERVRELRRAGRTIRDVALHTGYTMRQVYNILGSEAEDGAQGDLFADLLGERAAEVPASAAAAARTEAAEALPTAHNPFGL